jgi:hypothetical protein
MSGIGLMVGLLLAGLLGWYFLIRRTGGNIFAPADPPIVTNDGRPNPATAPPGSTINGISYGADGKPVSTDAQGIIYKGSTFITQQSSAGKLAAMSGASAYDPNNPAVAARTVNAIYVADTADAYLNANTNAYNAANGTNLTTDQYTALMAQIKKNQSDSAAYVESNQVSSQSGSSQPPGPPPGPNYYWNYVYNQWWPLPANTVTTPMVQTRSGTGHF